MPRVMTHFNELTPAEAERLAYLAEECGEAIQIIGKILRPSLGFLERDFVPVDFCQVDLLDWRRLRTLDAVGV